MHTDLLAVDADEALLHERAPRAELLLHEPADLGVVACEDIGLRRGVRALLVRRGVGHIVHKSVHVREVGGIVRAVVPGEPLAALLAHIFARIAHIREDEIVFALEIVEQLGVAHARLGCNVAQGHVHHGLALDAALKRHENVHADLVTVDNDRHLGRLRATGMSRLYCDFRRPSNGRENPRRALTKLLQRAIFFADQLVNHERRRQK